MARSRLYRSQFLQVNTRLKALDEIYQISIPLHLSDLNNFVTNFGIYLFFFILAFLKNISQVSSKIANILQVSRRFVLKLH